MAKNKDAPVVLVVESTHYGWTLKEEGQSHGLFVSREAALRVAKRRQTALQSAGVASLLETIGSEIASTRATWAAKRSLPNV